MIVTALGSDPDHDDMRVGLADVVLNRKARARTHRGRSQPRMIEFQGARRFDALHEGFERAFVLRRQAIAMGAGYQFLRMRGGERD